MNSETDKGPDALRSDINTTRQRMDETIDALGNRLKGRHLADEIIGYFRTDAGNNHLTNVKEKFLESTGSAVRSVTDTVKANPLPLLLIGAGVGLMIYQNRRSHSQDGYLRGPYEDELMDEPDYEYSGGGFGSAEYYENEYASDLSAPADEGQEPASGLSDKLQGAKDALGQKAQQAKDKVQATASQVQAKASQLQENMRQRTQQVRQRASELGSQVSQRSREIYQQSRRRVTTTVQEHPLETGLGLLALGIIAGLAIPTPRKVHEVVGPRVDQMKDRARQAGQDLVSRSRNVVDAAARAARQEAESQGLSPDALRNKVGAVADRAKQAASDTAQQEGVAPAAAPAV